MAKKVKCKNNLLLSMLICMEEKNEKKNSAINVHYNGHKHATNIFSQMDRKNGDGQTNILCKTDLLP